MTFECFLQQITMQKQILSENLLEDLNTNSPLVQQRVKMKFLEQEKQRLETNVHQLLQNVSLLRHINQQIIKNNTNTKVNEKINQQNIILETSYQRLLQQNRQLSSSEFLTKQICSEQLNEALEVVKNYQEKILQLRRSIQLKQSHVQIIQTNLKYHQSTNQSVVSPYNISVLFFQQIQDYKETIKALTKKNEELCKQNILLNQKISELNYLQNLIQSQVSYYQVRQLYKNCQINRSKSQQKVSMNKQKTPTKNREIPNTVISDFLTANKKIPSLLIKKHMQYNNLIKINKQNSNKINKLMSLIQILQQSNNNYKNRISEITNQFRMYKVNMQNLINYIQGRKLIPKYRSAQKSKIQQIIRNTGKVKQQEIHQKKDLSIYLRTLTKNSIHNNFLKKDRRCVSSIVDYIRVGDKLSVEKIQQLNSSNMNGNFSIMLDEFIQINHKKDESMSDPFEFSAIKPPERISYAELRNMRKNKNSSNLFKISEQQKG